MAMLAAGIGAAGAQTYITNIDRGAGTATVTTTGPKGTLRTEIRRTSSTSFTSTSTFTPGGGNSAMGNYQPMGAGGYKPMGR